VQQARQIDVQTLQLAQGFFQCIEVFAFVLDAFLAVMTGKTGTPDFLQPDIEFLQIGQ
jgi:hypothetical protein